MPPLEDLEARLRQMDYCAEYGFEYQGVCSRMVLTPQTEPGYAQVREPLDMVNMSQHYNVISCEQCSKSLLVDGCSGLCYPIIANYNNPPEESL